MPTLRRDRRLFMRARVLATVLVLAVVSTGCATVGAVKQEVVEDIVDVLDRLADHPLLNVLDKDADATFALAARREKEYAESNGTKGWEPMKVALARACPTATKAATADLKVKIQTLKARLQPKEDGTETEFSTGALMYKLTVLKYDKGLD